MFNALSVLKFAASGVVAIGTSKIVGQVIKTHVTTETLIDKVTVTAAAWVLSGVVTTATKDYTNKTIDDIAGSISEVISKQKVALKLARINRGESTFEQEGLDASKFHKKDDQKWYPIVEVAADEMPEAS